MYSRTGDTWFHRQEISPNRRCLYISSKIQGRFLCALILLFLLIGIPVEGKEEVAFFCKTAERIEDVHLRSIPVHIGKKILLLYGQRYSEVDILYPLGSFSKERGLFSPSTGILIRRNRRTWSTQRSSLYFTGEIRHLLLGNISCLWNHVSPVRLCKGLLSSCRYMPMNPQ